MIPKKRVGLSGNWKWEITLVLASFILLLASLPAGASLTVVGTATYLGSNYNLIYDEAQHIVWLDYTKTNALHATQMAWVSGLGAQLTVTLNEGYTTDIDWGTGWRFPTGPADTETRGAVRTNDGTGTTGYNITSGEWGYLYYTELENLGYYDKDGHKQSGYGLVNKGPFTHMNNDTTLNGRYWNSSEYGDTSFGTFQPVYGQFETASTNVKYAAMAVHSGDVSAVPIPGAVWLLGSGLMGLIGIRRRARKK